MDQQIQFCSAADGTSIAYATAGSGPVVVLVGSWMNVSHLEDDWEPDSPFKPVLDELAHHCTLVRYDWRGTGLSEREPSRQDAEAQLRDLEAVIHAIGAPPLTLMGVHLGGAIAITHAAARPAYLDRLIVNGSAADGPAIADAELRDSHRALMRANWRVASRAWAEWFVPSKATDASFVARLARSIRVSVDTEQALAIFDLQHSLDVRERLPAIAVPVLVAHATGDRVIPIHFGRAIASEIRGARLVPLTGEDHIPATTQSAQALATAVATFLVEPLEDDPRPRVHATPAGLSPREQEILFHVATGRTNREIADELTISIYTVNRHVSSILAKLGATNRTEAVNLATDRGLLR